MSLLSCWDSPEPVPVAFSHCLKPETVKTVSDMDFPAGANILKQKQNAASRVTEYSNQECMSYQEEQKHLLLPNSVLGKLTNLGLRGSLIRPLLKSSGPGALKEESVADKLLVSV